MENLSQVSEVPVEASVSYAPRVYFRNIRTMLIAGLAYAGLLLVTNPNTINASLYGDSGICQRIGTVEVNGGNPIKVKKGDVVELKGQLMHADPVTDSASIDDAIAASGGTFNVIGEQSGTTKVVSGTPSVDGDSITASYTVTEKSKVTAEIGGCDVVTKYRSAAIANILLEYKLLLINVQKDSSQ
ncbi:MAG: hypothetical protein WCO33_01230 [bacterium]